MAMKSNVIKFPYSVSRRAHSRKPRRSFNGTPEQRAAKAAAIAADTVAAPVIELSRRSGRPAERTDRAFALADAGPRLVDLLYKLRAYFVQELARGQDLDQIFNGLEESWANAEKALGSQQ